MGGKYGLVNVALGAAIALMVFPIVARMLPAPKA